MTLLGFLEVVQWGFLVFFIALNLSYVVLNLVSLRAIARDADARAWQRLPRAFSSLEPPVSIIVPAYNEEATIAGALRSLLQLEYSELEIVVVNDGSTDGTMEVLAREFELVPFPEAYRRSVPSRAMSTVRSEGPTTLPSRSALAAGLSTGARVSRSTMRNTSSSARPPMSSLGTVSGSPSRGRS